MRDKEDPTASVEIPWGWRIDRRIPASLPLRLALHISCAVAFFLHISTAQETHPGFLRCQDEHLQSSPRAQGSWGDSSSRGRVHSLAWLLGIKAEKRSQAKGRKEMHLHPA